MNSSHFLSNHPIFEGFYGFSSEKSDFRGFLIPTNSTFLFSRVFKGLYEPCVLLTCRAIFEKQTADILCHADITMFLRTNWGHIMPWTYRARQTDA